MPMISKQIRCQIKGCKELVSIKVVEQYIDGKKQLTIPKSSQKFMHVCQNHKEQMDIQLKTLEEWNKANPEQTAQIIKDTIENVAKEQREKLEKEMQNKKRN